MISNGNTAFICLCDRNAQRKNVFAFLEELSKNFHATYNSSTINSLNRPYALMKFGSPIFLETKIETLVKEFQDSRALDSLTRLRSELNDVQNIMTQNINDVLERGNRLENMSLLSSNLAVDSQKYLKDTRRLNLNAMIKKYLALVSIIALVLFVFYLIYKML